MDGGALVGAMETVQDFPYAKKAQMPHRFGPARFPVRMRKRGNGQSLAPAENGNDTHANGFQKNDKPSKSAESAAACIFFCVRHVSDPFERLCCD
jgi:hypothetical protein